MDLDSIIKETRQRRRFWRNFRRDFDDSNDEGEPADPAVPPFSIHDMVLQRGPEYIANVITFTWEEFQELFTLIHASLDQVGRGRKWKISPIDRFFVFLLYLTSAAKFKRLAAITNLKKGCIARIIKNCLAVIAPLLEAFFPRDITEVQCNDVFEDFQNVFGIVDASPVFINRPGRNQQQYYSGKFKRHCVKIQALVIPNGQCVHVSQVFRGRTHDKALFDQSGLAHFITSVRPDGRKTQKIIMGDLGYMGITSTCPGALLPHKRAPGAELSEQEQEENRVLHRTRVFVENYFARWKTLFAIVHERYRGDLVFLTPIIRITIALTNWHIKKHPLRKRMGARNQDSDEGEEIMRHNALRLDTDDSDEFH